MNQQPFKLDLSGFSYELRLLLELMSMENNGGWTKNTRVSFEELDWDLFLQLARHHRVYPFIYKELGGGDAGKIPQKVIQSLHGQYCSNTFQMLHLSSEMELVNRSFIQNQIRLLLLKGPVLAHELYGDISLRTSGDLDILISIRDLEKAGRLLTELGYVKDDYIQTVLNDWKWRHHHITFFNRQKGVKLEVHWRLNPGPSKEPGFNELWGRRRTSSFLNHPIDLLGREDLFLFLVSHGARHGWSRLRWLLDIDRLTQMELDWPMLRLLLKKNQLLHVGGQALVLASQLLNTPITAYSSSVINSNRSKQLARKALFYIQRMVNLHSPPLPQEVADYHKRHLFDLMSLRQKCFYILSMLYPYPKDAKTLPLPRQLHFLYFPLRPFLLVWRKTRKQALP